MKTIIKNLVVSTGLLFGFAITSVMWAYIVMIILKWLRYKI